MVHYENYNELFDNYIIVLTICFENKLMGGSEQSSGTPLPLFSTERASSE